MDLRSRTRFKIDKNYHVRNLRFIGAPLLAPFFKITKIVKFIIWGKICTKIKSIASLEDKID